MVSSGTSSRGEFLRIVNVALSLALIVRIMNADTVWTKTPSEKVCIIRP